MEMNKFRHLANFTLKEGYRQGGAVPVRLYRTTLSASAG
jgi:hypothetical protein